MICYTITSLTDDPAGVKLMESPTRTLKAILFPRSALAAFRKMDEAKQAGAYILYHTADKHERPQAYIGQSGSDVSARLSSHDRHKDFWNYAMVFVETKQFLNAAHAKIMESILIKRAEECGVAVMDNDTGSNAVPVKAADRAAAEAWANEAIEIAKLLGLPFFERPEKRNDMVLAMDGTVDTARTDAPVEAGSVTGKPTAFTVKWPDGENRSPFKSYRDVTIALCEKCIVVYGFNAFADCVCRHDFFGSGAKRKTFSMSEADMGGRSRHMFDGGLWFMVNYSAHDLKKIRDQLSDLFPYVSVSIDGADVVDHDAKTKRDRALFWAGFLDYAFQDAEFAKRFSRPDQSLDNSFVDFRFGWRGCHLSANRFRGGIGAQLYIGDDKKLFHELYARRDEIETDTGFGFDWRERPDKKACSVRIMTDVDLNDAAACAERYQWLVSILVKMKDVFERYVF